MRATRFGHSLPAAPPDKPLSDFAALERHSLLELEPPDHARLRALVNRAVVARRVQHFAAVL